MNDISFFPDSLSLFWGGGNENTSLASSPYTQIVSSLLIYTPKACKKLQNHLRITVTSKK